eukprot:CAMPEP_0119114684 /NCGR_PEP_ID=MMETSP1180-20130426/48271_1 /TAXON_ID=3052 ORGANISM="Chlamydomonas cf sp, Strain CCMP681" /NCGR_SAMPLE_ID=MMETSP1180 /ASSEMBLY_ACC=CAM_ASM_000741 /LENGTH=102 /DNA_ID=CAMNT_0007103337 /DNA_START=273 /DNA_END=582 /DNA_ORIENTATION=-
MTSTDEPTRGKGGVQSAAAPTPAPLSRACTNRGCYKWGPLPRTIRAGGTPSAQPPAAQPHLQVAVPPQLELGPGQGPPPPQGPPPVQQAPPPALVLPPQHPP